MSLRESIAKVIAPESVTLTTEYVQRLRTAFNDEQCRRKFLERENKRLQRKVQTLKDQLHRSSTTKAGK